MYLGIPSAGQGFIWTGTIWVPRTIVRARGAYAGGTAYLPGDSVQYNGSTYFCNTASTGNAPTDTGHWDLVATAGSSLASLFFSLLAFTTTANTPTATATNLAVGASFGCTQAITCTGLRFYWATASKTVRASLWDLSNGSSRLKQIDVAVSAAGLYTGTFSSAQTLVAGSSYVISLWQTDSANFTTTVAANVGPAAAPAVPFIGGPSIEWLNLHLKDTGDVRPGTTATDYYPLDPVFA